ncbi:DUF962 domain-containing protein [Blastocladiella britannica]|nr:DUF962 domain-containing protein [Blastocladiella britannica]
MSIFDFESQFIFYGAYHDNKWNKLVHIICVPLIIWSLFVFLATFGEVVPLEFVHKIPQYNGWVPEANAAFFVGAAYLAYYMILEPFATITYTPVMLLLFVTSGWVAKFADNPINVAVISNVVSWVFQIGAHFVFEKRAPAFLDSVHQALVMAPLFVWMEVLFMLGYKPEMEARMQKQVDVEIAKFRASQVAGADKAKSE